MIAPRMGTRKETVWIAYFVAGAGAAHRVGKRLGLKEASVRRWIFDWRRVS